jgi:hypothetical protein
MKLLKPALAITFLLGTLVCSNALAAPGHGGGHGGGHWSGHAGGNGGWHGGHGAGPVVRPGYVRHGYGHHGYRGYGRGAVIGLAIGAPLFWPGYGYGYGDRFYDPYYGRYYFTTPVYLPPSDLAPGGPPVSWYCPNPAGYYPQVSECLVPWRAVTGEPW